MMRNVRLAMVMFLATACWLGQSPPLNAAVPHLIHYQGHLVDSANTPLEGPYTLTFALYPAATGGTAVWQEVHTNIPVTGGNFEVMLGTGTPTPTPLSVDWSQGLWLGIKVGADPELAPRQQIASVPLAIRAEVAEGLSQAITPSLITPQGSGSGLDADTVDGVHASGFLTVNSPAGGDLSGTYPNPTINFPFTHVQAFTSNGAWTRPSGINKVWVKVWGGGGGGRRGDAGNSTGGGGGGGGGYSEGIVPVTGDVTVIVGAGGNTGTPATDGGNSSFAASGGTVQANGGAAGGFGGQAYNGGPGGSASGGTINIGGQAGSSAQSGPITASGGHGGGSSMGGHGGGALPNTAAQAAGYPGGGGGGGGGEQNGSAGASGLVIVYW